MGILNVRVMAISVVAVVSGISFALGFFVGRTTSQNPFDTLPALKSPEAVSRPEIVLKPLPRPEPEPEIVSRPEAVPEVTASPEAERPPVPLPEKPIKPAKPIKLVKPTKPIKPVKHEIEPVIKTVLKPETKPEIKPEIKNRAAALKNKQPAYCIQAGAFHAVEEAQAFRTKLKAKGYDAYMQQSSTGGKAVYRVRVGRAMDKKTAAILVLKLKKAEGIEAFVTRPE